MTTAYQIFYCHRVSCACMAAPMYVRNHTLFFFTLVCVNIVVILFTSMYINSRGVYDLLLHALNN
jgi:hypothetical protein